MPEVGAAHLDSPRGKFEILNSVLVLALSRRAPYEGFGITDKCEAICDDLSHLSAHTGTKITSRRYISAQECTWRAQLFRQRLQRP
jgi:hypothetical protein